MMSNRLWVVEMLVDESGQWEPTIGTGLDRDDARHECNRWMERNPNDRFRIRCYIRRKIVKRRVA